MYTKLYAKMPKHDYHKRIEELKASGDARDENGGMRDEKSVTNFASSSHSTFRDLQEETRAPHQEDLPGDPIVVS